jgi:hypothetical protein
MHEMALTEAQRAVFYTQLNENNPFSPYAEARESKLREWYRIGQSYFRGFMDRDNHIEILNDLLPVLGERDEAEREGFLMGWQSDAYAHDHGMRLSVEGTTRIIMEDYNEPTEEPEGDRLLDGSSEWGSASED